ncbi:MAG: hypothetical protein MJZ11_08020 [Lachnospiraceae bacterium]|nr:hypothetical protein [Lachnospiraceae bacterium]
MPVSFTFVTPTGKLEKKKFSKGLLNKKSIKDPLDNVIKNAEGKYAYMESVDLLTRSLVTKGASEILGVINCASIVFQRLVARTPLDEEYDYVNINKLRDMIQSASGNESFDMSEVTEHHVPDNNRIRDHWRLTININSQIAADVFAKEFDDKIFDEVNDINGINAIASKISSQFDTHFRGRDKGMSFDYNIVFTNNSDHFAQLEYGRYKKSKNGIKQGEKYQHGVDGTGYVIQAPNGFYRKSLLELNAMLNKKQSRDVSRKLMKYYVGKNPDLKKNIERWFKKFEGTEFLKGKGIDIKFDDLRLGEIISDIVNMTAKDNDLKRQIQLNLMSFNAEYPKHVNNFEELISKADFTPGESTEEYIKRVKNALGDQYDVNIGAITFYGTNPKEKNGRTYLNKREVGKQQKEFIAGMGALFRERATKKGISSLGKNKKSEGDFVKYNKLYSKYSRKYPAQHIHSRKEINTPNVAVNDYINERDRFGRLEDPFTGKSYKVRYLSPSGYNKMRADLILKLNKPIFKKRKNIITSEQNKIYRKRKNKRNKR